MAELHLDIAQKASNDYDSHTGLEIYVVLRLHSPDAEWSLMLLPVNRDAGEPTLQETGIFVRI